VHHQVGVGDPGMDLLDAVDPQDVAGRLLGELIGTMGGTDGDRQGVDLGLFGEIRCFIGIGQHLIHLQLAFGADTVLFTGFTRLQRTQAAQFTLYGHTAGMGHFNHLSGDFDVVFVTGRGLGVFHQGAVHHHRREAGLDGAQADRGRRAMVLVHHDRDMGIGLDRRQDQMAQERLTRIGTGTRGALHDNRAIGLVRRLHDGMHLLHIVDVEGRHAEVILSRVVQQLTHGNQRHDIYLLKLFGWD